MVTAGDNCKYVNPSSVKVTSQLGVTVTLCVALFTPQLNSHFVRVSVPCSPANNNNFTE